MDSIAKTSLLTAAMRAVETNRTEAEGRLFQDPYAELLAGAEGFSILKQAIAAAGDQPAIAIRTAFMDKQISDAVLARGVRQVVMLAAGMDTRAYRMKFPSDLKIFELDRKEVLEYKSLKLSHVKPVCQHVQLAVDLRHDWTSLLVKSGFQRGEKTLWLVEGLMMYLEEADVLNLIAKINSLSISGDEILFDILSRTLLEAPAMRNQLDFLSHMGAAWKFGCNEPEEFFYQLGWVVTVTSAGEFAPTRWPFPVAPRHIPNVPRGFYAKGIKK
jgi:methyltransferase (TIGR00027 family)